MKYYIMYVLIGLLVCWRERCTNISVEWYTIMVYTTQQVATNVTQHITTPHQRTNSQKSNNSITMIAPQSHNTRHASKKGACIT